MEETIDSTVVRDELERIATSDKFARSGRMQELLRYLVENDLAGNGDRLRSFNIAIDVFGRDAQFDPNNDSIVRVEAARLRRMLAAHYAEAPATGLRITIPKGRYLPAYEELTTPDRPPLHRPIGGPAIAVLPFSGPTSEVLLCEGLTAELRFQLSRFAEFRVVDATSLSDTPPPEIAKKAASELECKYIVQGRVTRNAAGKRIHVEALDATNSHVLWSQRYQVHAQDARLLDVEEDIASEIARALAPSPGVLLLNGFERGDPAPKDWDAVDCVLRWHHFRAHTRSPELHHSLVSALRRVLDKHPGFAMGWAILAYMTLDGWIYRLEPESSRASISRKSRTYAERALGLAPRNSQARYVIALCDYFERNFAGFRDHFFAALELNPNSLDLLHHGGTLLAFGGDWEDGKELVLEADLAHNNAMGLRFFYVVDALRANDLPLADSLLAVVKPTGSWYWGHLLRAVISVLQDNVAEARQALNRALAEAPDLEGNLQGEVNKWFAEPVVKTLFAEAFARITPH